MIDSVCGINVDISFNMAGGMESAKIIRKFVSDPYIGPATKALILVLKQFLSQRYLNEVFSGGLGSYALVVMIVSFLSLHPLIQSKQIKISDNIGTLLIEFLELYGKCHQINDVGIGLDFKSGGYYFNKWEVFHKRDGRFCIQDPQDKFNDISQGSFSSFAVRTEFFKAFGRLSSVIGSIYEKGKESKRIDSILGSILTISKDVVARREGLKELCLKLGDLELLDLLTMQATIDIQPLSLIQKKKSESLRNKEVDVIFVDNSSCEEGFISDPDILALYENEENDSMEATMELYKLDNAIDSDDYDLKGFKNISALQSMKKSEVIDLTLSDEGDITSYYNI